jgi:TRAP-type C4-dicarboxylate transport system substrate-binding protein
VTTGHYKFARNYTLTEHTMSPEVLIMSLRAWQSLSDADKVIFRDAARESNRFMREQWTALETQSARVARQAGVTIVSDFDRKPFEAAMAKIDTQAAADPIIGPMIDRIRQVK